METQIREIEKTAKNKNDACLDVLKTTKNRHWLLSNPELHAAVKVESSLLKGARHYFEEQGFTEIVVPHMTKATGACENIATMFEVDYFGPKRYLSQTGQLYLEVLTPFLNKVWCVGPSFRAEPSVDERHLTEFTLVELEFAGDFEGLLQHVENVICSMVDFALKENLEELVSLSANPERLRGIKRPFQRMTYTKAVELLSDFGVKWGDDLKAAKKRCLSTSTKANHCS